MKDLEAGEVHGELRGGKQPLFRECSCDTDRASPGCGAEDPGVNHSGGVSASHSAPLCAYYTEHRDHCADPTSSRVQKDCVSMSHTPSQSPSQGDPGMTRWGALGCALRSLEDETKRAD